MPWEIRSYWEVVAAVGAGAVLVLTAWGQFAAPRLRRWRLRHPCKAYFHITQHRHGDLGYVVQDDDAHRVRELVVPSHSIVEIEIAYDAIVAFHVYRTVFGIEGDSSAKPLALERFSRFIAEGKGKTRWIPGVDATDSIDREDNYHYDSYILGRSIGSCYTMGFEIKTREPGVYKAWLGFLTDEVDGSAQLSFRVEDSPRTRMRCESHSGCTIRPARPRG